MKNVCRMVIVTAIFICAFAASQFVFADNEVKVMSESIKIITETIAGESADTDAAAAVEDGVIGKSPDHVVDITDERNVKQKNAKPIDGSAGQKPKKSKKNDNSAEQDVKPEIADDTAESNIAGTAAPGRPLDGKSQKSNKKSAKPAGKESPKSAAKKDGTEFKLSGVLETGFDINHRVDRDETTNRALAKGEIEISARPAKRVRAEIGIEYNMRDTFVTMDKLYGVYGITDDGSARAGIMKKMFGLEERAGVAERYFRSRSIINSALDDYGFLDHDLTLQYRQSVGENWRFGGGFSWSVADSLRYLQNYSAQYDMKDMTFILAAIIRHYDIPERTTQIFEVEGVAVTFVSSLSAKYDSKFWVSEAELTLGTNPRIKIQENNRNALIFGARAQERFPIDINTKILRQIIPVAELAMYWDDLDKGGSFDTQLRMGLALGFAKNSVFQLRNTFGTTWRTADGETNVRRYRYDSEVVVIF